MSIFKEIDQDCDGVIDPTQFEQLYKAINFSNMDPSQVSEELPSKMRMEMISLLDVLDPTQSNKIFLSDIIPLFMSHKVKILEQKPQLTAVNTDLNLSRNEAQSVSQARGHTTEDTGFNSKNYQVAMENEVVEINNGVFSRKQQTLPTDQTFMNKSMEMFNRHTQNSVQSTHVGGHHPPQNRTMLIVSDSTKDLLEEEAKINNEIMALNKKLNSK